MGIHVKSYTVTGVTKKQITRAVANAGGLDMASVYGGAESRWLHAQVVGSAMCRLAL